MSFFKENVKGSNVKPEILHEDKMDESEKMSQNGFFDIRPLHGENTIWIFTKDIQAKINELESESKIFA